MARRTISTAEMQMLCDRMMNPNLTGEQLIETMNQTAQVLGISNRNRAHNAQSSHRAKVRAAAAAGDTAELRRLANLNLTKRG